MDAGFFDTGEGNYNGQLTTLYPLWTLRSKYWRQQTFPKGKDVTVEQSYVPVVASQSTLSLGSPDMDSDQLKHYRDTFCTDESFLKAAHSLYERLDGANLSFQAFEQYLSYVITSAVIGQASSVTSN